MPRNRTGPHKTVLLRLPLEEYEELILLSPDMQDAGGELHYGAINGYFIRLLRDDLERKKNTLVENMQSFSLPT